MSRIRTLFFDIGGVLLSNGWDRDGRVRAIEQFQLDWEEFRDRHDRVALDFDAGLVGLEDYLQRTVFYRPRPFTREEFTGFMYGLSTPIEPMLALARRLAGCQSWEMAAINNESRELNQYRIERFALDEIFHAFFSSCYLGVSKPDPRIYQRALDISRRRPEECLFVDDRPMNLEAAHRIGLRTILCRDAAQVEAELRRHGIMVAGSIG